MGKAWVLPSFKQILIDASDEFMNSSDKGKNKARTALISRVADEIRQVVEDASGKIPDDLEKAIRTWFGNEAAGYAKEDPEKRSKVDTRGHPTSVKSWNAKSVCGRIHADRISDVQLRLSGGEEKVLAKYHPALTEVFGSMSAEEMQHCEKLAIEWNHSQLPEDVQRRMSKKIPSDVAEWTEYMRNKTGAVFFVLGAYTDEDGKLCIARYETSELGFLATRKEYRKGPNNVTDVWKNFIEDKEEMADGDETLELNEEGYPRLPDDVLTLRLSRKKSILRQFMSMVRRYFKLTGRIPWGDIAENPSRHLGKASRPDSDHKLMDPSHMKAEGVDDWLKHWLKMQNRKKRPLTLRNPIEDDSTKPRKDAQLSKGNAKGKQKAIAELQASSEESDKDHTSSGDEASDEENDDSGDREKDSENGQSDEGEKNENASDNAIRIGQDESCLPPSPSTAAKSKKSRFAFLKSLSDDKHYRQLVRILHAAKDGPSTGKPAPEWASWSSEANFLPKSFHSVKGYLRFKKWIHSDPLTVGDDSLTSYGRVELIALSIGLAMRELWINQFQEDVSNVPPHVTNSPVEFREYEQLSHAVKDLLAGYDEVIEQINAMYPENPADGSMSTDPIVKLQKIPRTRIRGLASIPVAFYYMREEVGLAGQGWVDLGERWHKLAALWLRAETLLGKSGQGDLTFQMIFNCTLPEPLKDWLNSRILRTDATRPGESFGKEFTAYLADLPWSSFADETALMSEIWCRPGKTGIIVLMVGLYWHAIFSGSGKTWDTNVDRVESIFTNILNISTLQREKRGRAESSGVSGKKSKRTRT